MELRLKKLELARERIRAAEVCLQDLNDPDTAVFLVKDAIMLAADAVVMDERKLPRRFGKLVGLLSRRIGEGEELRKLFREGRRFQSFRDAAGRGRCTRPLVTREEVDDVRDRVEWARELVRVVERVLKGH
ncbi:MAG: hypothetical protein ABGY09_00720 [Euryarchaeota archaeon]